MSAIFKNGTWYGNGGGGSIDVDSDFSTTSENPVQNKTITGAIGDLSTLDTGASNLVGAVNETLEKGGTEISFSDFEALSQAEKDNGTSYFITDADVVSGVLMGNRFDRADIYSETERLVGQWIDGKPVYQRVFETDATMDTSFTNLIGNWSSYDVDVFISAFGIVENSSTDKRTLSLFTYVSNNYLQGWCHGAAGAHIVNVILKYTKTTDMPISIGTDTDYSADEKIIGSWIDGKPIYQKTLQVVRATVGTEVLIDADLANVVDLKGIAYWNSYSLPLPHVSNNSVNNQVAVWVQNTKYLYVLTGSSVTGAITCYITVQYTKTTD